MTSRRIVALLLTIGFVVLACFTGLILSITHHKPVVFDKNRNDIHLVSEALAQTSITTTTLNVQEAKDKDWTIYTAANSGLAYDMMWDLAVDEQGQVWVGTSGGVSVLDPAGNWTTYTSANSGLVDDGLNALTIDKQGRVWVGTVNGLSMLDSDGHWTTYTVANSELADDYVWSLVIDKKDRVWIGTDKGLNVLDPAGNWTTYTSDDFGLADERVFALAVDGRGRTWLGTFSGGLSVFNDGNWTTYTTANSGLASNLVRALFIDKRGRVWVGTDKGVSVLVPAGNWTTYTTPNSGLASNLVSALFVDEQDRVWVGTSEEGLSMFDPLDLQVINTTANSDLAHARVTALIIDEKDQVWLGTYEDGLGTIGASVALQVGTLQSPVASEVMSIPVVSEEMPASEESNVQIVFIIGLLGLLVLVGGPVTVYALRYTRANSMNSRYFLITVVITGIAMFVFAACPIIPIIGGWVVSIFGVLIYQRFDKTKKTTPKDGALIGFTSGILTGSVIPFLSILFPENEIALGEALAFTLLFLIGYSVLGAIGGAVGGAIFKPKMIAVEEHIPSTEEFNGTDSIEESNDIPPTEEINGKVQVEELKDADPIEESNDRFRVGIKAGLATSVVLLALFAALVMYSAATGGLTESALAFFVIEVTCLALPAGTIGGGLGGKYLFTSREEPSWVVWAGISGAVCAIIAIHLALILPCLLPMWAEGYEIY
jgi:streptogramin lyase